MAKKQRSSRDLRLRLELLSVPASVSLVRSVIGTVAHTANLDRILIDDLRTAVSEACNNVVLHAYRSSPPGPMVFSLAVRRATVEAVVRDRGSGIRPGCGGSPGLGMGVSLINMLADRAEFQSDSETGTEVRMTFKRPAAVPETLRQLSVGVWTLEEPGLSGALRGLSG